MVYKQQKWKIYYDDGTTFSDEDGTWEEAPYRGVLLVVTSDPNVGREVDHGARGEFYAWWPDATKPWGFDRTGILDYLANLPEYDETTHIADLSLDDWNRAGVKVGRSVDNHVFEAILEQALADDYFAPKSADTLRERRE